MSDAAIENTEQTITQGIDNPDNPNEWLDQHGVAKYIGVSNSQVCRYMQQYPPPWPFYRVSAVRKLTKRADLDAWLEKVKSC